MKMQRTLSPSRWFSVHAFFADTCEPFLIERLTPWLSTPEARRLVKRFFFIRYSEGGQHLRLRFQPRDGSTQEELGGIVRDLVEAPSESGFVRLAKVPYDRTEHYFGESLASVYSELLNQKTSELALDLLSQVQGGRLRLWLVLVGMFDLLLPKGMEAYRIRDLCDLGESICRDHQFSLPTDHPPSHELLATAHRASGQVAQGFGHLDRLRRTRRFLDRASQSRDRGRRVAAHALHLLANKLGFTPTEELAAARLLAAMRAESVPPRLADACAEAQR